MNWLPVIIIAGAMLLLGYFEISSQKARARAHQPQPISPPPETSPETEPPVPETVTPRRNWSRLANMAWAAFWLLVIFPFAEHASGVFSRPWEEFGNLPDEVLTGAFNTILAWSPFYGLTLLTLLLTVIVCRVKSRAMQRGMFLRVRLALMLVAIVGSFVSLFQITQIADDLMRFGGVEIPEDDAQFKDRMLVELARVSLTRNFDSEVDRELDAGNVERARIVMATADLLGRPVSSALRIRYEEEASFWNLDNLWRLVNQCASGGLLRNPKTITHMLCMFGADLVYIPRLEVSLGDVLDLGIQLGDNFWNDAPIDPTIASMAAAGIAIDVIFPNDSDLDNLRPGLSAVKISMRAAKRLDMAPGVEKGLRRLAANTIDADAVRHVNLFNVSDTASRALRPEGLKAFQPVLDDLQGMFRYTGSRSTPILAIRYSDELAELTHFKRISRVFGKNADGVIDPLGKSWKHAFRTAAKAQWSYG